MTPVILTPVSCRLLTHCFCVSPFCSCFHINKNMYTYIYIYIYIYSAPHHNYNMVQDVVLLFLCFAIIDFSFLSSWWRCFSRYMLLFFFFFLRRASPTISTHCTSWVCICSVLYIHVYVCIYVSLFCMFFFLCIFPDKYNVLFFFFVCWVLWKSSWKTSDLHWISQHLSIHFFLHMNIFYYLLFLSCDMHTQKKKRAVARRRGPDRSNRACART